MRSRIAMILVTMASVIAIAFIVGGCMPSYTVSPNGDLVRLETVEGMTRDGEFLWMSDSDLVLGAVPNSKVNLGNSRVPLKSIRKLTALGYRNDKWTLVTITQAIAGFIFVATAASYNGNSESMLALPIMLLIPALELLLFTAGNSNPSYTFPLNDKDQTQIVKHARFVRPPTERQQEYFRAEHLLQSP